jgi:hypothetical protein
MIYRKSGGPVSNDGGDVCAGGDGNEALMGQLSVDMDVRGRASVERTVWNATAGDSSPRDGCKAIR